MRQNRSSWHASRGISVPQGTGTCDGPLGLAFVIGCVWIQARTATMSGLAHGNSGKCVDTKITISRIDETDACTQMSKKNDVEKYSEKYQSTTSSTTAKSGCPSDQVRQGLSEREGEEREWYESSNDTRVDDEDKMMMMTMMQVGTTVIQRKNAVGCADRCTTPRTDVRTRRYQTC